MAAVQPLPRRRVRTTASVVDPVARYLDQIGRYPLLTPEQERRLAAAIADGRRAAELLADGERTPRERSELRAVVRAGETAFDAFVNANLRLVVSVAKRYQATGVPLLDLVQEGNLGLIRAVEKFDHTKGFRFSTYGVWWIRQFISRGIAATRSTVRLPTRANDDLQRLRAAVGQLEAASGRTTSTAELAALASLSDERVIELLPLLSDPLSFSTAVGDGNVELGDFIEDPDAVASVEEIGLRLSEREIDELLSPLDPRERTIIVMRFGFDGEEPMSMMDISRRLGLSRERVRQLEHRAMAKLVHPSRPSVREFIRGC
ncbi:MAG: sigma-70 family RNA polymerase sigma factor [Acidimicrobiales bacterium]